ncbi:MAG: hypothetical protein NZ937_07625 [Armatimonadetes bacterium]|nr:hypothetical protein [Armatimonadota bacterium]
MKRYNAPVPNCLRALFDHSIFVPPFKATKFADIEKQGEWSIRNEIDDDSELKDWHEYADLICIAAINAAKRNQMDEAQRLVAKAAAMWDGNGVFDKAALSLNCYATYKLALLLWAAWAKDHSMVMKKRSPTTFEVKSDNFCFLPKISA